MDDTHDPTVQTCSRCRETKPLDDFSPSYRGKKGTWCRACFAEYNSGNRQRSAPPEPRPCAHCGAIYTPQIDRGKYCSPTCKQSALYWKRNPPVEQRCAECGVAVGGKRRDVVYCSNACARRAKAKRPGYSEMRRNGHLKSLYGITHDEYEAMLARQKGRCAICGADTPRAAKPHFAVDHDHVTGQVRGVLCHPCNTGIGQLQDDPNVIAAALKYVRKHRQGVLGT